MTGISSIIPNKQKAVFLAKKQLPELVVDAVNLEGINYTLPEVQTLLEGVTVGGYRLQDETITLNQAAAWKKLFADVESEEFSLDAEYAQSLHAIAGKQEALEWGVFRSGGVTIAGTDYQPASADVLVERWSQMVAALEEEPDIYPRAIKLFLTMARNQFFYDVNKRMGRFMMNGLLLQAGYPAINLPASKKEAFNRLMLEFYPQGQEKKMIDFMLSCLDIRIVAIMSE